MISQCWWGSVKDVRPLRWMNGLFHFAAISWIETAIQYTNIVKRYRLPILVTERWARSWSRCTGSQPAGDLNHPPSDRLPLLSTRPEITFPAAEHHCSLAGTYFTIPGSVEGWVNSMTWYKGAIGNGRLLPRCCHLANLNNVVRRLTGAAIWRLNETYASSLILALSPLCWKHDVFHKT